MKYKNYYNNKSWPTAFFFLMLFLFNNATIAFALWDEPSSANINNKPTNQDAPYPRDAVDTGPSVQTKAGDLIIQGLLTGSGQFDSLGVSRNPPSARGDIVIDTDIKSDRFCFGTNCISSWSDPTALSGQPNRLSKWKDANYIESSGIVEDDSSITIGSSALPAITNLFGGLTINSGVSANKGLKFNNLQGYTPLAASKSNLALSVDSQGNIILVKLTGGALPPPPPPPPTCTPTSPALSPNPCTTAWGSCINNSQIRNCPTTKTNADCSVTAGTQTETQACVPPPPPPPSLSCSFSPTSPMVGELVTFNGGGAGSYSWEAPEGSPLREGSASTFPFVTRFSSSGTKTVRVKAGSVFGFGPTATCQVTVRPLPPITCTARSASDGSYNYGSRETIFYDIGGSAGPYVQALSDNEARTGIYENGGQTGGVRGVLNEVTAAFSTAGVKVIYIKAFLGTFLGYSSTVRCTPVTVLPATCTYSEALYTGRCDYAWGDCINNQKTRVCVATTYRRVDCSTGYTTRVESQSCGSVVPPPLPPPPPPPTCTPATIFSPNPCTTAWGSCVNSEQIRNCPIIETRADCSTVSETQTESRSCGSIVPPPPPPPPTCTPTSPALSPNPCTTAWGLCHISRTGGQKTRICPTTKTNADCSMTVGTQTESQACFIPISSPPPTPTPTSPPPTRITSMPLNATQQYSCKPTETGTRPLPLCSSVKAQPDLACNAVLLGSSPVNVQSRLAVAGQSCIGLNDRDGGQCIYVFDLWGTCAIK